MQNEISIGVYDFFGTECELYCTYSPEYLEIEEFRLFRPKAKKNWIVIDQDEIICSLMDIFDNDETEALMKEDIAETYAYEDFVESHSARRLG